MVSFKNLALVATAITSALAAPAPVAEPDLPDFELGGANLARRQDYTQNYKTGGNVNFQPTNTGYSVQFSGAGDFVVGKGWSTGSSTRNVTFSGSTSANAGTVLVSLYGWSTNPLVEYYVQEYSNSNGAAQGQQVGTLQSDGATYNIWKHQQVNQPSIQGTSTFWQYISVRTSPRPNGGTITFSNHVNAWAKLGMNLGQQNYQTISTEGWGNAGGSSQYTVHG